MSQEIRKVLGNLGLSEDEAKTYLAALQLGKATVYEIAKTAGLKRPSVYVFVERLAEKGILAKEQLGNKTLITPAAPSRLIDIYKGKIEALESVQPQLASLYQKSKFQPKVQVFEGEAGVEAIYHELLSSEMKGREVLLFGSIKAISDKFSHLFPKWENAFANQENTFKDLLNDEPENEDYIKARLALGNPNYEIRQMSANVFGKTDNIIYGNKLAVFSLQEELFVIIIESEEVVRTYRALFNEAWKSARVVR